MNNFRKNEAWNKRNEANLLADQRPTQRHKNNGDEQRFRHKSNGHVIKCHENEHKEYWKKYYPLHKSELDIKGKPSYVVSFTKGMPHSFDTGLLKDPQHFQYFVRAIDSGDPRDFRDTPLGPDEHMGSLHNCHAPKNKWKSKVAQNGTHKKVGKGGNPVGVRAWESQSAGLAFDLEGPDSQSVTMPPVPKLGSAELTAEMAEVYVQALLRDVPFNALSAGIIEKKYLKSCDPIPKRAVVNKPLLKQLHAKSGDVEKYLKLTEQLKKLDWFSKKDLKLNPQEEARRCHRQCPNPANAFRGITRGDKVGPYLSQFFLIGNTGINSNDNAERKIEDGLISYGSISIDQRVRTASSVNYMTKWEQWFDVQNAANVGGLEEYENGSNHLRRFIHTPRDLATYVHYDALYEAYLNACLLLLNNGVAFDPGIPFQEDDNRDHQQGFAHFGGPHILSLVTEVATRALKAVRFQKYNIHRRCRPEVLAARLTKADLLKDITNEFKEMKKAIGTSSEEILGMVNSSNGNLFESKPTNKDKNYLLPMAFCEGSPMHPAYGAGHATVAGACVTILKAFFDCNSIFKPNGVDSNKAYVSVNEGKAIKLVPVFDKNGHEAHLTVEGELNKLASNISIGRNWAGVHYFTDYYESLLMGEQIAIGILEEQKLMFGENFSMTIPLFGGDTIRI